MNTRLNTKDTARVGKFLSYGVLIAGSLFVVFPFLWMLSTSLKEEQYLLRFPPQWLPNPLTLNNYRDVFELVPLVRGFLNSSFISLMGTFGVLLASSLAGFGFAKLRFPGRDRIFVALLATLMIPGAVLLIPQFLLFRGLGWLDTFNPLIIPSFFGAVYETFFFRQFFRTLPNDLLDAAKIDGASFLTIYWRIALPLSKPVFATMGILAFMGRWNDYLGPLIYLQDPMKQTVPVMISTFQSQYITAYGLLMAGSVLSILPIIVLFFFLQRYFVEGIVFTGLKG
jgi:multiple sugar transport system permease protein